MSITGSIIAARPRFEHLDLLRGLAALLVVADALRAYVFVHEASLVDPGPATALFYWTSSLGHQAAIVFFALSGFLVGGPMLKTMGDGDWSWRRHLARRLTRLWIVLIPALLVTAILDRIGMTLGGGAGYDGIDLSLQTFIGNAVFLPTIAVPAFGTHQPVWCLANIFWYYILFALFFAIFLVRMHALQRIFSIVLLLGLVAWLPAPLLRDGLIWLAGALMARAQSSPLFRDTFVRAALLVAVAATLYLTTQPDADAWTGIVFGGAVALALPGLAQLAPAGPHYRAAARAMAEISFSLYLSHFPFLTLIALTSLAPPRFHPGLGGTLVYIALFAAALIWAAILWWCFERHTDRVYGLLARRETR